jgi:hypothetical protein
MTRLNIDITCRLIYKGNNCRYESRHEDTTYWICDRTNEKFSFTDDELARALAGQDLWGEDYQPGDKSGDALVPVTKLIRCRRPEGASSTTTPTGSCR